jgi:hypothetical protein
MKENFYKTQERLQYRYMNNLFQDNIDKTRGPHKESKEPTKAFLRDRTREWAIKFASLKLH